MDTAASGQQIGIEAVNGIIRVEYRGLVEYGPTTAMLRRVVALAAEADTKRVLFDIRAADYSGYLVNAIRHAEEGRKLGLDSSFRCALLGVAGIPMLHFIETVSVIRGYVVKAFTDEFEAAVWLAGRR